LKNRFYVMKKPSMRWTVFFVSTHDADQLGIKTPMTCLMYDDAIYISNRLHKIRVEFISAL